MQTIMNLDRYSMSQTGHIDDSVPDEVLATLEIPSESENSFLYSALNPQEIPILHDPILSNHSISHVDYIPESPPCLPSVLQPGLPKYANHTLVPDQEEDALPANTNELKPPNAPTTEQKTVPKPSSAVEQYMKCRKVPNTEKANVSAFRCFCSYVLSTCKPTEEMKRQADFLEFSRKIDMSDNPTVRSSQISEETLVRNLIFPGENGSPLPSGHKNWTDLQMKTLQYYLMEFVVGYRSKTGDEVTPSTMKTYILGLQRYFDQVWGYKLTLTKGPVFNDEKQGLMTVINNRFSEQQSRNKHVVSHNVLTGEDVKKLFESAQLSRATPASFQCRLLFGIALMTAMRPTELRLLRLSQFSKLCMSGEEVWKICSRVGSIDGTSKTSHGGWNAVNSKPKEVIIWNITSLGGSVNIYADIEEYMAMRNEIIIEKDNDRFFAAINKSATSRKHFFKGQPLGEHSMRRIIQSACLINNITGSGGNAGIVTHSLRGTVATLLLEAGTPYSAITMRTGHKQVDSLKHYQNLRGIEGKKQQNILFPSSEGPNCVGLKRTNEEQPQNQLFKKVAVTASPIRPSFPTKLSVSPQSDSQPKRETQSKSTTDKPLNVNTEQDISVVPSLLSGISGPIGTINININSPPRRHNHYYSTLDNH